MKEFFKKYRIILILLLCVVIVYTLVYIDITLRARSAYYEAEKYMEFYYNPQKKIEYFENIAKKEKEKLDKLYFQKKLTEEEYKIKLELIEFNKQRQIEESSLKYAYIWYKTVIDLFSPPESKWVKLARSKLPTVKSMWKNELEQKGYKIEDYMIE